MIMAFSNLVKPLLTGEPTRETAIFKNLQNVPENFRFTEGSQISPLPYSNFLKGNPI
jgi:hypothetical protein